MIAKAAMTVAMLACAGMAQAQDGAEFFNGKTVTYVVATEPGGGYDTNGRLVAEFMQKHLPGSTFVVRNMPGAGHIIGAQGGFHRSSQHPAIGGVVDVRKTEVGAFDATQIILARSAASLAA